MASPLNSPYQLINQLNAQWRRLCDGLESAPAVAATVDQWHRSPVPELRAVHRLEDALAVIERQPDQVLGQLVTGAQAGDKLCGRVILQALLPKLVLIARSQQRPQLPIDELLAEACAVLWERVATYPLGQRPTSVAANLTLDTLKAVRREHHSPEPLVPVPSLAEYLSEAADGAVGDELAQVLGDACKLGVIEPAEARLLARVYRYDEAAACAAELGVSAGAVRKRCTLLKARLRPHALDLVA